MRLNFLLFLAGPLLAATNEEIPKLAPPRGEIPPSFWEQHGLWVVALAMLVLVGVAVLIWRLTRPKPPLSVPVEIQARQALEPLRERPEDGRLLSRVSQVLRHYVAAAFELPPGELTTTEFCAHIARSERLGSELSSALGEFLRRCDERKFSPAAPTQPLGAAAQAIKLLEEAEARREQWRQSEAAEAARLAQPGEKAR